MTNKIKYIVKVNGRTIKSGSARVDNHKFAQFERETLESVCKECGCSKNDRIEFLFR